MEEVISIQWFPGHMTRTKRQLAASLKLVDCVAEIIDARVPFSSRNPDLRKLINNKPRIVLMNKCDIADKTQNQKWIAVYKNAGITALPVDCKTGKGLNAFMPAVRTVLADKIKAWEAKGMKGKTIKVMVVGIPNVGKSSFINKMVKQSKALRTDLVLQEVISGLLLARALNCLILQAFCGLSLRIKSLAKSLPLQVRFVTRF